MSNGNVSLLGSSAGSSRSPIAPLFSPGPMQADIFAGQQQGRNPLNMMLLIKQLKELGLIKDKSGQLGQGANPLMSIIQALFSKSPQAFYE